MTSIVTANMRTCDKTTKVEASMQEDGTVRIKIITNCDHVKEYAKQLTDLTLEDLTDFSKSKVVDPKVRASMSPPCIVPNAVFNAAWMETGMLSKRMAQKVKENSLFFNEDE